MRLAPKSHPRELRLRCRTDFLVFLKFVFFFLQNLQSELEKTKVKCQELENQKTEAQGKLDELDKEVRELPL